MMVSAQVALSMVLLVVAGLVLRSLAATSQLDPGFSYHDLVASYVSTSSAGVDVSDRERFFRVLANVSAEEPWVRAATVADSAPLSPHSSAELRLEGQTDTKSLVYSKVIPGYFETLGIEVVSGRSFEVTDTRNVGGVAVVNQTLAERFLPCRSPWPSPVVAEPGRRRGSQLRDRRCGTGRQTTGLRRRTRAGRLLRPAPAPLLPRQRPACGHQHRPGHVSSEARPVAAGIPGPHRHRQRPALLRSHSRVPVPDPDERGAVLGAGVSRPGAARSASSVSSAWRKAGAPGKSGSACRLALGTPTSFAWCWRRL